METEGEQHPGADQADAPASTGLDLPFSTDRVAPWSQTVSCTIKLLLRGKT